MQDSQFSNGFFIGICVGFCLHILFRLLIVYPLVPEAKQSVSEYINHPENFKIEYVTYNGDTTATIVTYIK